jgi:hypothetical protein
VCRALECTTASRSHAFLSTMHHSGLHRGVGCGHATDEGTGRPEAVPWVEAANPTQVPPDSRVRADCASSSLLAGDAYPQLRLHFRYLLPFEADPTRPPLLSPAAFAANLASKAATISDLEGRDRLAQQSSRPKIRGRWRRRSLFHRPRSCSSPRLLRPPSSHPSPTSPRRLHQKRRPRHRSPLDSPRGNSPRAAMVCLALDSTYQCP